MPARKLVEDKGSTASRRGASDKQDRIACRRTTLQPGNRRDGFFERTRIVVPKDKDATGIHADAFQILRIEIRIVPVAKNAPAKHKQGIRPPVAHQVSRKVRPFQIPALSIQDNDPRDMSKRIVPNKQATAVSDKQVKGDDGQGEQDSDFRPRQEALSAFFLSNVRDGFKDSAHRFQYTLSFFRQRGRDIRTAFSPSA